MEITEKHGRKQTCSKQTCIFVSLIGQISVDFGQKSTSTKSRRAENVRRRYGKSLLSSSVKLKQKSIHIFLFINVYMSICSTVYVQCPKRPEEGTEYAGTTVMGICVWNYIRCSATFTMPPVCRQPWSFSQVIALEQIPHTTTISPRVTSRDHVTTVWTRYSKI